MKLSDHDLQQINLDWLRERTPEELLHVSQKLLDDLKEARERLNQNSTNTFDKLSASQFRAVGQSTAVVSSCGRY